MSKDNGMLQVDVDELISLLQNRQENTPYAIYIDGSVEDMKIIDSDLGGNAMNLGSSRDVTIRDTKSLGRIELSDGARNILIDRSSWARALSSYSSTELQDIVNALRNPQKNTHKLQGFFKHVLRDMGVASVSTILLHSANNVLTSFKLPGLPL